MAQNTANYQDLSDDDKNVCRACMSRKKNMMSVFSSKKPRMYEMFVFCTGIRISRYDSLPKKLCNSCLSKLDEAYKFKLECLQTQKTLHATFEINGLQIEDIKTENVDSELDLNDIDLKEDSIKEEIFCETVCISDDNVDDGNLDYKPNRKITKNPPKSCAKETKNNRKQLIAKIPTGVSVKIIDINKGDINQEKKNIKTVKKGVSVKIIDINKGDINQEKKNIKTVKKVKSKKYIKKTSKETSLASNVIFVQNLETSEKKNLTATERRLYCTKCDILFKSSEAIKEHKLDLHPFEATICEICGEVPHDRYTHMKSHEVPSHKCELCDYASCYRKDLEKHVRIHKDIKEYVCEYCTRSFRTLSNVKFHIRAHHGSIEKKYACPRCSYRSYGIDKLRRHMDAHDNIKRYECEICNSRYARREQWKKHVETTHNILIPKMRPGRQKNAIKFTSVESYLKNTQGKSIQSDLHLKSLQGKSFQSDFLKNVQKSGFQSEQKFEKCYKGKVF